MRSRLIGYSVCGGTLITALAVLLRMRGHAALALYLSYPGVYSMQSFLGRFLDWLPGGIGDNLIAEFLAFTVANAASFAFVIFLVLRIFLPDRTEQLPPLVK